jgi:hypothetical protein
MPGGSITIAVRAGSNAGGRPCAVQPGAYKPVPGAGAQTPAPVLHLSHRCYTRLVPTTRPRYTITDTGSVSDLLDDAQRRWPEIRDRKELLLRLARAGHNSLRLDRAKAEESKRRERQRAALASLQRTVDWEAIRDDQAWV